jgi:hypothetical protein
MDNRRRHRSQSSSSTRRTRRRSYSRSPSSSPERRRRQDRYHSENNRSHLRERAKIAKSISTAFVIGLDTAKDEKQTITVMKEAFSKDNNTPLRGIPSQMIYQKADDIFISLESCRNCLFLLKRLDRDSPILKIMDTELSELAKIAFDEIRDNHEHNNPKHCLDDPITKYYDKEANKVFRILWFLRDLWHHLFNHSVQMTSYEAMNFLLDQKNQVSVFIPSLFRFVQKHLRPEFDVWLGRSFLNLIPFFAGNFLNSVTMIKEKIVYIRTSENDQDEHIPVSVPEHSDFRDFLLLISKETNIRLFKVSGKHNNVPIRMQKIEDVKDGAIVIVKQTDADLETKINNILSSWKEKTEPENKPEDIFRLQQKLQSSEQQKEFMKLASLYYTDRFYFIFKLLKMPAEERTAYASHFATEKHVILDLMNIIFEEEQIQEDSESPLSSQR